MASFDRFQTNSHNLNEHLLFLTLFVLFGTLISTNDCSAQNSTWRYVATLPGGIKSYLNDEAKVSPNKNKTRWEKIVKSEGISATALVEWNCSDKLRLTRQITFYNSDQSVVGTKKNGFDWSPIIPGSSADFLYRRVCLKAPPVRVAEITTERADLRFIPVENALIVRTAKRGEKFQIVSETGKGSWFNIVDPETQEDYWLTSDSFKAIDSASAGAATPMRNKANRVKNRLPKSSRKSNRFIN